MLHVLTLATLFPDASRPNFGVFVERQTLGLAARPDVALKVVAPIGIPPWPLSRHARYRNLLALPAVECWRGVEVHRPRFVNLPGTGGRFHASALARRLVPLLTALRRDFPFDVIDAEFFFPDGPAAVTLGRHFGVPVSIKARGADIHHWGRHHWGRHHWGRHHWGRGGAAAQVVAAGRAADGLLAVSQAMRADMITLGMPADRIKVHHTGVDLDRFALADRAAAKRAMGLAGPVIASVGALIARKGHGIVVRALADLPDATLLIVGEGPARPALVADIARLGLEGRVRLLGAVPHAELPAVLAAADVMALASASEGLANAWVEALACGVPIVVTDVGGAREVLTDPSFGRLVARAPDAFAKAIAALLADPPAPTEVRQGAARFTWAANSAALFDHLSGLVRVCR